jgi:hypothetical protein
MLKHAWEFWTPPADANYGTGWGYRVARLCTRCSMVSYAQVNSLGQREPWKYKAPEGYSLPADEVPTQEQLTLSIMAYQEIDEYYGDKPITRMTAKKRKPKKAVAKRATPRKSATPRKATRGRHLRAVG